MRNKLYQRNSEGFTIIEVLIVLAIAGLIMLIVFLAVPALQRNAHNTTIKNDVSSILGGISEFANNNDGVLPTGIASSPAPTTTGFSFTGASGSNDAAVKVGYVDGTTVNVTVASGTISNNLAAGVAKVYTKAVCSGNDATSTGATSRNVVVLYGLEGGAKKCQAS